MPQFDRFMIAPINTGLQQDVRPWLIMDDGWEYLQNVYCFRGRIRKRFGSLLMGTTQINSRLRINIGNTPGPVNIPNSGSSIQLQIGQMFSVGTDIFYVYRLGNVTTYSTNSGATATINTTVPNNTVTFTGEPAGTAIYWYPALPVMGIAQYESGAINNHPTYAWDTKYVYTWSSIGWERSGATQNALWHGTNLNFFWVANWQGTLTDQSSPPVMLVTNFNATLGTPKPAATDDPIWYTPNGSDWYPLNATSEMFGMGAANSSAFYFLPAYSGTPQTEYTGPFVQTCRIIIAWKNRLLLLNTIENDNANHNGTGNATAYVNRCRFSFYGTPFARNAWYEPNQSDADTSSTAVEFNNIAAGGGFVDAATEEQIISAEFIKDRLIVYFERSTWELAYSGNEQQPFNWLKINTELGSQSTFSTVPFDQAILTIGNTGIHDCSGSNVKRIDNKIPEEIFEFQTKNNNTLRTVGIRDYVNELTYWTFVSDLESPTQNYPNQILVYNYRNESWALNDDCFTFFGYFEQQTDTTWASSAPLTWEQANGTWISGVKQANQRQILAGTPEGFIVRIAADISRNAPSMQITNITFNADYTVTLNIINHNFTDSGSAFGFPDYILVENVIADAATMVAINGKIFPVSIINGDLNNIKIGDSAQQPLPLSGTYAGGGTGTRVSNTQLLSKQFNPYADKDRNVYVQRVDFAVMKTQFGQLTIDYYPSATEVSMIAGGQATQSIMGTSILETTPYDPSLYPLEQYQQRLWHPVYLQSEGNCIQLAMYLSEQQMTNYPVALSEFELEAMTLFCCPTSSRMQ